MNPGRFVAIGLFSAFALIASFRAAAITPEEHAAHHPDAVPAAPAPSPDTNNPSSQQPAPAPMAPGGAAPGAASMGMMSAMDAMMKSMGGMMSGMMGGGTGKPVYPALMALPDLPMERRAEVQMRAQAGMQEATREMDAALGELSSAAGRDDYAGMQQATARLRQAVAQFDSGLAAHRALAEGQAPRNVALQWFKREMNLLPPPAASVPHGFFGLSAFHYLTMATIAVFAALLAAMTWSRQRRATELAQRLMSAPAAMAVPAAVRPPASPLGGWSGRLRVARIFQETADVKTFRLAPVSGEDLPFSFEPGQFLTVSASIDGKTVRRSYSIASSPCCRGWCELTVKLARGGAVSGYLHQQLRVGDVIDASGPYGRFTFRGREADSVVMIAGGVGITPMMSSIRYLADQSWDGEIFLFYACQRLDAVIFRDELEHLARRHPNLHLTLVLNEPPSPEWSGPRGFVTAELLQSTVPDLSKRRVHLCGPPPMMEAVQRELAKAGLPETQLKTELFLSPERPKTPPAAGPQEASAAASCRFARSGKTVPIASEQTVLEAGEAAGLSLDYSCRQGFCGVCKTRLLEGTVTMAIEDGLAPTDKAAGYILSCQAKAQRNVVVDA